MLPTRKQIQACSAHAVVEKGTKPADAQGQ